MAEAMGVVTDLGSRDTVISVDRPNIRLITRTVTTVVTAPARQPSSTGSQFSFSSSRFS